MLAQIRQDGSQIDVVFRRVWFRFNSPAQFLNSRPQVALLLEQDPHTAMRRCVAGIDLQRLVHKRGLLQEPCVYRIE